MGKQYLELTPQHIDFIQQQKIFFVATAAQTGSVNLSPKGGDSLRVIDHKTIVWQNLTGSGNESAAHTIKNPRMTLMWCAFKGAPLILRTYGNATVLHQTDPQCCPFPGQRRYAATVCVGHQPRAILLWNVGPIV